MTFVSHALTSGGGQQQYGDGSEETFVTHALTSEGHDASEDGTGRRSQDDPNLVTQSGVRRLTPTECERLQGWPDGWTQLGNTADSKRYAACGDGVTATVSEWIGRRILARD